MEHHEVSKQLWTRLCNRKKKSSTITADYLHCNINESMRLGEKPVNLTSLLELEEKKFKKINVIS